MMHSVSAQRVQRTEVDAASVYQIGWHLPEVHTVALDDMVTAVLHQRCVAGVEDRLTQSGQRKQIAFQINDQGGYHFAGAYV